MAAKVLQWHTDPLVSSDDYTEEEEPAKLSDLINTGSTEPLYLQLERAIASPAASGGGGSNKEWLSSILSAFDLHVTRALHTLHVAPWDREHAIRAEYMRVYGVKSVPPEWNIRAVMARLLTYREVVDYCERAAGGLRGTGASGAGSACAGSATSFLFAPTAEGGGGKEVPLWSIDCLSGGIRNPQQKASRFMTGLNPRNPRLSYPVTFERPWSSSRAAPRLDPLHHWGVYVDRGIDDVSNRLGLSSDAPIRTWMACCAEPVGKTDGCWMTLADDTAAVEGIVKPYTLFTTVFNKAWERMVLSSTPPPTAAELKKDYAIGTAFKDYAYYDALHKRIQASLGMSAAAISDGYARYVQNLQTTLDQNDAAGDALRETNPYERILTEEEREYITQTIRLQHEFNKIQCIHMDPPLMRDYVNERVFRVLDMLKWFTFERMGGLEVDTQSGGKDRLPMLATDRPDPVKAETLIQKIQDTSQTDVRITTLNEVADELEKVRNTGAQLERRRQLRAELQKVDAQYESISPLMRVGLEPSGLIWADVKKALKDMENVESSVVAKQRTINDVLRALRTRSSVTVSQTNLPPIPSLSTVAPTPLVKVFKQNIRATILAETVRTKSYGIPQRPPKSPALLKLYQQLESEEKKLSIPPNKTLVTLDDTSVEIDIRGDERIFNDALTKTAKERESVIALVAKTKGQLVAIDDSGSDDTVQLEAVKRLAIEDTLRQLAFDVQTKVLQPEAAATNTFNAARTKANQAYQAKIVAEQQRKAAALAAAKQAVKAAAGNVSTFTVTATTADPKTEVTDKVITPLLAEVALLRALDPTNQTLLAYARSVEERLQNLQQLIPTKEEIAGADPKIRVPLVAALANTDSILLASKRLAEALSLLAEDLNDASRKQTVDNILAKALPYAEAARNTVETVAQMQERLRREAEEKRIRDEQERLKREAEDRERVRIQNIVNRAKAQILVQAQDASRIRYSEVQPLVEEANRQYAAMVSRQPYDQVAKMLGIDGHRTSLTTTQYFWDDNTEQLIVTMTDDMLFLGDVYTDSKRWEAFIEGYALFVSGNRANIPDILNYAQTAQLPVDQSVPSSPNTYALQVPVLNKAVTIPPTGDLITARHFRWVAEDGGTCPYDSIFSALFKVPGLWLETAIYNARQVTVKNSECLNDVVDGMPLPEWVHQRVCKQIRFLQDPNSIENGETCITKRTWKNCISVDSISDLSRPLDDGRLLIGDLIKYFYKMQKYFAGEVLARGQTVIRDNPLFEPKELLSFTLQKTQDQLTSESGQVSYTVPLYLNNKKFTLISCVSFQPGHWVSYVRDPRTTEWWHFNAAPGGNNVARKIGVSGENVPFTVTTGNAGEQPCGWYYMRVPEALIRKPTPPPPPSTSITPSVTAVATLRFSDNAAALLPFGDNNAIEALFDASRQTDPKPTWMIPEWLALALLDREWKDVRALVLSLDRVRLEGLLHAWYAVRIDSEQRFVVGMSRADMDMDALPSTTTQDTSVTPAVTPAPAAPESQTPPPTPGPGQPPAGRGVVLLNLFGDRLFAKPTNMTDLQRAFDDAQQLGGNSLKLGLGIRFDAVVMEPVLNDSYRLTGLMHAWWGLKTGSMEAQVRGMSMADL